MGLHTDLDVHISRALGLLEDKSVVFLIIRTKKAQAAPRAMKVVAAVKEYVALSFTDISFRHREGISDELKQYIVEEGPKVINLDTS